MPFEVGEYTSVVETRSIWHSVPTFVEEGEFSFWQVEQTGYPNLADGVTTFEVLTDGPVLLACTTRWGGGNSSGGWTDDVTTRYELELDGWEEFATGLTATWDGDPVLDFIVFKRDSVAGETFTYRTEKYRAPVIIRGQSVIPEPTSMLIWATMGVIFATVTFWRRKRGVA